MKAVVAAFNQEKALVGAFSVITNLRMELFEALLATVSRLPVRMIPVPVARADEGSRGEGGAGGAGAAGGGGAGVRRVAPAAGRQHQHQPRRHHCVLAAAAEFKALTSLSAVKTLHSLPPQLVLHCALSPWW